MPALFSNTTKTEHHAPEQNAVAVLEQGLAVHGPRPNDWTADSFDLLLFPNDYDRKMN
jgi:hypothetical protein